MNDTELYHHGVKGMKWGVRRARKRTSVQTSRNKAKRLNQKSSVSDIAKSSRASRGKKVVKGIAIGVGATATVAVLAPVAVAGARVTKLIFDGMETLDWASRNMNIG